jgi:hypothetical protein
MSLKLIAEFGPFVSEHISRFENTDRRRKCYLCSTTIEEFIHLMADKVTSITLEEIKKPSTFP